MTVQLPHAHVNQPIRLCSYIILNVAGKKLITYAKNDYRIDVAQLKTIYIYIYLPKEKKRTIKGIKNIDKIDGSLQKKGLV